MNPIQLDYVSQEDSIKFCGPACVKMLLSHVRPTAESLNDIYQDTDDPDSEWPAGIVGSTPLGIEQAVSTRAGNILGTSYRVQPQPDRALLTRQVCWAIESTEQLTPIVLVHVTMHWVVVNGFYLDSDAVSIIDPNSRIEYLSICDPGHRFDDHGVVVHEAVTRREWESLYLCDPVYSTRDKQTRYVGKYIALYPDDAVELPVEAPVEAFPKVKVCESCSPNRADDIVAGESLFNRDPWSHLRGNVAGKVPMVVAEDGALERMVCLQSFVSIDPANGAESDDVVLKVRYDCNDGAFLNALAAFETGRLNAQSRSLDGKSAAEALETMNDLGILVEATGKMYKPSSDDLGELRWQPGYVSMTPFLPYYRILAHEINPDGSDVIGDDGVQVVADLFVRVDLRGFLVAPDSEEDRNSR